MGDEVVTTGVDDLLAYLKDKDRVALQDAAVVLGVPLETLQAWVDFLVEEKILGLEYKFTKPYVYLNKEEPKKNKAHLVEQAILEVESLKQEYVQRAREKQIPDSKIPQLWRSHVLEALGRKREYFLQQAIRRHAADPQQLWERYQADLLSRC